MRLLFLLLCLLPFSAEAKLLVADVSQHRIAIDSRFKGTSLLIFGARGDAGDIIVVVRGPAADFTLRKKERHAGIWVNADTVTYKDLPYYYSIASTRPLPEMQREGLLENLAVGPEYLDFSTDATGVDKAAFRQAFLQERFGNALYTPLPRQISFMGDTLFKTVVDFPATIPRGNYTAEVYLIQNNRLLSMQSTPIKVEKEGFDAFVFDMAHGHPLFYGLIAVMLAFTIGWAAGLLFRKV